MPYIDSRSVSRLLSALVLMVFALQYATAADAKTLRTNILADPAMVDPITYSELISGDVIGNVYEAFTALDKDGNVVPALATKWEALEDNAVWRISLREGVTFHSGREFSAKDVKYTFEQLLLPGNKGGLNARYLKGIVGVSER